MKPQDKQRPRLGKRIWIGFSADGMEIVATYGSRAEVKEFRQLDEVVTGPWVREPRKKPRSKR